MPEIFIDNFEQVELSPPKLDVGSGYHFNIESVGELEESEKTGSKYFELALRCLDGPKQSEADPVTGSLDPKGRRIKDRVYLTEGAKWRIKALLISAGLLNRDDKTSDLARGKFNTDILQGAVIACTIEAQMRDGKEYRNVVYEV